MRFDIKLHVSSKTSDHKFELWPALPHSANGGQVQFVLDGEAAEADWAEVSPGVYSVLLNGLSYEAQVSTPPGQPAVRKNTYVITVRARDYLVEFRDSRLRRHASVPGALEGPEDILAPMPGKIVKILVTESQKVGYGDGLVVIEAMKMQNELRATRAGQVDKIYVSEGAGVETGCRLLRLV